MKINGWRVLAVVMMLTCVVVVTRAMMPAGPVTLWGVTQGVLGTIGLAVLWLVMGAAAGAVTKRAAWKPPAPAPVPALSVPPEASYAAAVLAMAIELKPTCIACPEQYDALLYGNMVGYLRLRGGIFTVHCPTVGGVCVVNGLVGDALAGTFDSEQARQQALLVARVAIAAWVLANKIPLRCVTHTSASVAL